MHDPMTVAHEIKSPWKDAPSKFWPEGYRQTLVTIWHVDPERDGSDDSCGWFMRPRHGDAETLEKIKRDFAYEWDSKLDGWFETNGMPRYSSHALALIMFRRAAHAAFKGNWSRVERFMRRHVYEILLFAENPTDSMHSSFIQQYGPERRERRIESMAAMVYGCVIRWDRPWYRHPRWHLHHWKFKIHHLQAFKRWAFSRCCRCSGRFAWGESPTTGQWNGGGPRWFRSEEGVYHGACDGVAAKSSGMN